MRLADYEKKYAEDHQDARNMACHMLGIPLIIASIVTVFYAPLGALGLFATGWVLQFLGHYFEGKKPSFTTDLIYLVVGPIYFFRKFWRKLS